MNYLYQHYCLSNISKILDLKEQMELSHIKDLKDGILVIWIKNIEKLDYEFAKILERSAFHDQSFRKQTKKQQSVLLEEIKIFKIG